MSCSLAPRPGVPVDGYLFGLNSVLGPIVTLPYDDPELLAAGRALGAGTLRWPGGVVANFWSIKDCNYAASAISTWKGRYDAVSQRPGGTFSPLNFWNGVGSAALGTRPPVWVLNVHTLDGEEMLAQVDLLHEQARRPAQREPSAMAADGVCLPLSQGVPVERIELGNELNYERYSSVYTVDPGNQTSVYMEKIAPLCQRIRERFPAAQIGVVGGSIDWNRALARHAHLFDALVKHRYGPNKCSYESSLDTNGWLSATVSYGRSKLNFDYDLPDELHNKPWWITEFGLSQNTDCGRHFQELDAGALRGAHWLSWLLGAIERYQNQPGESVRMLTYHIFSSQWSPVNDRATSLVSLRSDDYPGYPSSSEVNGIAQIFAHVSALALRDANAQMRTVDISAECPTHVVQTGLSSSKALGCLQAAAFGSSHPSRDSSASFVVVNACHQPVGTNLDVADMLANETIWKGPSGWELVTTRFNITDPGGWKPLAEIGISTLPWTNGSLRPMVSTRALHRAELDAPLELGMDAFSITIATIRNANPFLPPTPPSPDRKSVV